MYSLSFITFKSVNHDLKTRLTNNAKTILNKLQQIHFKYIPLTIIYPKLKKNIKADICNLILYTY